MNRMPSGRFLGRRSLAADTADRGRCGMLNAAGSLAGLPGRALHVKRQRSASTKVAATPLISSLL